MANDILPFCPTDTGTNLLTQSDYAAAADRTNGNQPGIASSKLNNKAIRQSAFVSSQFSQMIANMTSTSILDDGVTARLLAQFTSALTAYSPIYTKYTSGSSTHNLSFMFQIATGSATIGATYTNNGVTYTVAATVASATVIRLTGNAVPLTSGTLTKASGTGDATLTFYAYRAPKTLRVRLVGAGGGGAGSGTSGAGAGGNGSATTFGTALLSAGGGSGAAGAGNQAGGAGGTASLGTGPTGINFTGANGGSSVSESIATTQALGGMGADSFFGGRGPQTIGNGGAAIVNSGSGGSGGSTGGTASTITGAGGGAAAYIDANIDVAALGLYTFAVVIAAAPAGGTAGTAGFLGGAGGSGFCDVLEQF